MKQNTADAPFPALECVEEWAELVDRAMEGLHHALNNRIGSLSALVELYQLGDMPADGSGFETLSADMTRLQDCNRAVRLLTRDPMAAEEPLIVDDVLMDVFAVHRFLHEGRDLQVVVAPGAKVEPVRVRRWVLVHALTLLLRDAKRLAKEHGFGVRAELKCDEQWVRIEFRVSRDSQTGEAALVDAIPVAGTNGTGRYAALLAESLGGTVDRSPGIAALRLPTLKARRAADRR